MVTVIYSDDFLDHQTGTFHPERPQRLEAIVETLNTVPWRDQLTWKLPTPISEYLEPLVEQIQQVHSHNYIQQVQALAENNGGYLDGDTPVSPRSFQVAMLAVSAWLDGVDLVTQQSQPAFVLARPPGHHAERDRGMGFCLFSNAAIAAYSALEKPGINQVGILDWDVHHGNGTQSIVEDHPHIAYCSMHQSPCYPGTGSAQETGMYNNVLNIPMSPGSTMAKYQPIFEQKVIPFFQRFNPDLLIVSAGYDANKDDPLANINLHPADYGTFTKYCLKITHKILFGLEGGYDLPSLSESVAATLEACLTEVAV
ncbi:MAG: histone deacetylase [Microcoleaceae cyanobacterium]